jgi:hypothetical protein
MENYNYYEAMKEDITTYIEDNKDYFDSLDYYTLQDAMWTADEVTGNGSGSYFFNTYKAEEALCHNLDLLGEALQGFGCDGSYLMENGAEACDVTIRCYLLGQVLQEVLDEMDTEEEEA